MHSRSWNLWVCAMLVTNAFQSQSSTQGSQNAYKRKLKNKIVNPWIFYRYFRGRVKKRMEKMRSCSHAYTHINDRIVLCISLPNQRYTHSALQKQHIIHNYTFRHTLINSWHRQSNFKFIQQEEGKVLTIFVHAEAIIIYLGLNCRFWMGPGWSLCSIAILAPVSVLQQWTLPSVDPEIVGQNYITKGDWSKAGMELVFYHEPATKDISWQTSQPCKPQTKHTISISNFSCCHQASSFGGSHVCGRRCRHVCMLNVLACLPIMLCA